jgi:hypothetical protein
MHETPKATLSRHQQTSARSRHMPPEQKSLTYPQIVGCEAIQKWLAQFDHEFYPVAIEMLCRLKFISRDVYSLWLKTALDKFAGDPIALFAVRKFDPTIQCIWDQEGNALQRPAESQGSEDLVMSVIANMKKGKAGSLFDHPDIETIRSHKIQKVVLLDDSMGSGKRVADFIKRMMTHRSFLSWWSYGKVRIEILSYSRTMESENAIRSSLVGSNHHARTFPACTKIEFYGHDAYQRNNYIQRWGRGYQRILDLCDNTKQIRRERRRGYGKSMANTIFYHSVPNNVPGVLWFESAKWHALFPQRTFPGWLEELLEGSTRVTQQNAASSEAHVDRESISILAAVRLGARNENSIAWNIGLDRKVVANLMLSLRGRGLLTIKNRLTCAGRSCLKRYENSQNEACTEFNLYMPKSWCAGRETIQPTGLGRESERVQSESETGSLVEDGESGQDSLERTDAKTASPSLSVMTQFPSMSRERHDRHGPFGSRNT